MPQRTGRTIQPNERRATDPYPLPVPQELLSMRSSRIVGVGQTAQQQAFNKIVNGTPNTPTPQRRLEAIPQ
jgi:hypothetical protein